MYECCGNEFPVERLNTCHYASVICKQGDERRLRHETLQWCFKENMVLFQINAEILPPSEAFTYIGQIIAYNNRDWAALSKTSRYLGGGG